MQTVEIKELIEQLKGLNERELYSGLAVLSSGYKADWIKNIQCEVVPRVKKSSPNSPYLTEESKKACRDIVARVTNPDKDVRGRALEELKTNFVTDYYVEPGKLFFEQFRKIFKEVIFGRESPYGRFKKGLIEQSDLPSAMVDDLLMRGLAKVYIPLWAYFALLIIKTVLKVHL